MLSIWLNRWLGCLSKMANIVYIATSVDGYIATEDGSVDWLHEIPNHTGSDYGFSKFMERVDALVMGRNTYETVLSFGGDWPYAKKVFVLSNNLKEIDASLAGKVELISGDLKNVVKSLNEKGFENLYIDGGKTVQSFLKEDLIDELIISRIPIILGAGIPLFEKSGNTLRLKHRSTEVLGEELVQSHYVRRD